MKKILSIFLIAIFTLSIIITCPIVASADDLGYMSYKIVDGEAIITSITLDMRNEVPSKIKGFPVTTIDYEACYDQKYGSEIIIPDGVKTIESAAFANCKKLSKITLPDSITRIKSSAFSATAYYNNKANWENGALYIGKHLIKVDTTEETFKVKEGTLTIADYAFYGISAPTKIILPKSLKNVGINAFTNCKKLRNISVAKDNKYLSSKDGVLFNKDGTELIAAPIALSDTYIIPNGVKVIREAAFQHCDQLYDIVLPKGVEEIGRFAFWWCSNLEMINLPDSVKVIGVGILDDTKLIQTEGNWVNNAFYIDKHLISTDAEKLTGEYTVKEGTKTIAGDAFSGCTKLEKVNLPDSLVSIGDAAFSFCEKIEVMQLPDSVTYVGRRAFDFCESLKTINIPKNVTTIREDTFSQCKSLTNVKLPSKLKIIENSAFKHCNKLKNIDIPSGVTHIGAYAFSGCGINNVTISKDITAIEPHAFGYSAFKEVVIPKSVTYIGEGAFTGCSNLEKVTLPKSVKYVELRAFEECKSLSTIKYKGTEKDKKEISIGKYNYYFTTAVWKYEPKKITSSKNNTASNTTTSSKKPIKEETASIGTSESSEDSTTESQNNETPQTDTNPQNKQSNAWIIWIFVAALLLGSAGGFTSFQLINKKQNK